MHNGLFPIILTYSSPFAYRVGEGTYEAEDEQKLKNPKEMVPGIAPEDTFVKEKSVIDASKQINVKCE